MNSQVKQQWIQALRSNEYSQTQGNLRSTEGYCCLGVLCDLYAKETGDEWTIKLTEDEDAFEYYRIKDQNNVLPDCVVEWSGLNDVNPIVLSSDDCIASLAGLNDEGKTFEEIAQLIQEQL